MTDRVLVLDGLRGAAIFLVLLFHYFGRWTVESGEPLYPYGDILAGVFGTGYAGVYLFFLISGFVIFRSLTQSRSIVHFAMKRARRLVPAMLVVSTFTFLLLAGPLQTEYMLVGWADFFPSWTFTPPALWTWLSPNVGFIDGAYWTLVVEVKFYALMALVYFTLPKGTAVLALTGLAIASVLIAMLPLGPMAKLIDVLVFPQFISLFAAGAIYATIMERGFTPRLCLSVCALILSSLVGLGSSSSAESFPPVAAWTLAFHGVFVSFLLGHRWTRIFSARPLVFLGIVSYSLYLVHQRIGVAIISRLPQDWPILAHMAGVAMVTLLMISVAYLSWRFVEQGQAMRAGRGPASAGTGEPPAVALREARSPPPQKPGRTGP